MIEISRKPNMKVYGTGINWLSSIFLDNLELTQEDKSFQIEGTDNFRLDTYSLGCTDYEAGDYLTVLVELLENDTTLIDSCIGSGPNYWSLGDIWRFNVSSFNPESTYRFRYSLVV